MVVVKLANGKDVYFDGYLLNNLRLHKHNVRERDSDLLLICDGPEGCQPENSKVLMADGEWKLIQNIKVGDEILSPQEDGTYKYAKVLKTYEWFSKETYDVHELHRDKKLLYSCSHNHEIPININKKFKDKTKNYWTIEHFKAEDFFNKKNNLFHNTTSITSPKISRFKDRQNCKIEPYTLGVFLGDGSFRYMTTYEFNHTQFGERKRHHRFKKSWQTSLFLQHKSRHLSITSADFEIIEEVSKYYPILRVEKKDKGNNKASSYMFSSEGELAKLLIEYKLNGKRSGDKFIPKEALLSNIEYRKRLLAGLIDTDGYLSKEKSYSITTKSKQLAEDILFLIYSLGGRGTIRTIFKKCQVKDFFGKYYSVSFYLGDLELPLKTKRKQRDKKFFYLSANRTSIKLEKKEGKKVYGFTLDSNSHWYITDNFMVTKNSGKSVLSQQIAMFLDETFTIDDIAFDGEDFKKKVLNAKKFKCILFDESLSALNKMKSIDSLTTSVVDLLAEIRQRNLFIIIVLPSLFDLVKPIACWRSKFLIHVFTGENLTRGYFSAYNYEKKMVLYTTGKRTYNYGTVSPNFRGRFTNGYMIDEEKYRQLKSDNLRAYLDKRHAKETRTEQNNRYKLYKLVKYVLERHVLNTEDVAFALGLSKATVEAFMERSKEDFSALTEDDTMVEEIKTRQLLDGFKETEERKAKEEFLKGIKRDRMSARQKAVAQELAQRALKEEFDNAAAESEKVLKSSELVEEEDGSIEGS